jgi:hypothetical protein
VKSETDIVSVRESPALSAPTHPGAVTSIDVSPHTPLDPETSNGPGVLMGEKLICTLTSSNAGLSPDERSSLILRRLQEAIKKGISQQDVWIRALDDGQRWGVFIKDSLLMVASPEDARSRDEHAAVTAERWARNLRSTLPRGQGRDVNISPSASEVRNPQRFVFVPSGENESDNKEFEERIDELETRVRQMCTEVDQAKSEADDLESYVRRFGFDNWRDVVPLVRRAAIDVIDSLDAIDTSDP